MKKEVNFEHLLSARRQALLLGKKKQGYVLEYAIKEIMKLMKDVDHYLSLSNELLEQKILLQRKLESAERKHAAKVLQLEQELEKCISGKNTPEKSS